MLVVSESYENYENGSVKNQRTEVGREGLGVHGVGGVEGYRDTLCTPESLYKPVFLTFSSPKGGPTL